MNSKLETITKLFKGKEIRSVWDSEREEYYFSVVDVISALTNSTRTRKYWNDLKMKLESEGSQLSEKIGQLKLKSKKDGKSELPTKCRKLYMTTSKGKNYPTDVLDIEGYLDLLKVFLVQMLNLRKFGCHGLVEKNIK